MADTAGEAPPGREKRAGLVARQLAEEIDARGWPPGTLVGTEEELVDRLGVGRGVLREATRLLEDGQVARMRRGRGGGLVVVEPDGRAVTGAVSTYLESVGVTAEEVFDARLVLDTVAVERAADRIDEDDLVALRALLDDERTADDDAVRAGSHRQVHTAIAAAGRNPAIALFARTLAELGDDQDTMAGKLTGTAARAGAAAVHRAHHAIVEAIIAGDGALAAQRMRKHLGALRSELRQRETDRGADPGHDRNDAGGDGPDGADPQPPRPSGPAGPAAAMLARRIRSDILRDGWPVGHSLGSEQALLERYGTGRAVLREAARILEHHAVAEMRRGPGGGLVVRAPDGEAVVAAVVRHLGAAHIDAAALFEAREALEAATLRAAAGRLDDDGRAALVRAAARTGDTAAPGFAGAAHDFHVAVAHLSGNRTLELFVTALTRVTAARMPGTGPSAGRAERRGHIDRAHDRIAEALLEGDVALARRRMLLHLRALECATI